MSDCRTISRAWAVASTAFVLLLIAGCKEEQEPLFDVLDGVDAKIDGITAVAPAERLNEIAAYLATRSDFAETGIADSAATAWGRMPDGEIVCVLDQLPGVAEGVSPATKNYAEGYEEESLVGADSVQEQAEKSLAPNRTEMPGGMNCHIASSDHLKDWLHDNALGVYFYLSGGERYGEPFGSSLAEVFSNGSIERLAMLTDVGVFYIHSVVSAGRLPNGAEVAALMTSVDVTPVNAATYRGLLLDGSLVVMDIPNMHAAQTGGTERLRRFGITSKFIREKVQLAPNALVYIDAGYGNHADLQRAFLDIGASVYLAWNGMPSVDEATNKAVIAFFMHTMNEDFYEAPFSWPDSPVRPFDYQNVYSFLMNKGWGRDSGGGIPSADDPYLALTEGAGDLAILCPSVAYLKVDENPENPEPDMALLHIYGSFGSDPGQNNREVYISQSDSPSLGEPLPVLDWSPAEIRCLIPAKGSAGMTSGRVMVINRGIKSNAVALTEWFLPVTMYSRNDNTSLYDQANFTLHIRLDVHGYRSMLNQPYPLPAPPESLYEGGSSVGRYSSGAWVCGGAYADTEIQEYPAGMEPSELGGLQHNYWFQQSGSGSFAYTPDFYGNGAGVYATVLPWYDPITLEVPKPPVKIQLHLYYSGPKTISWGFVDLATMEWEEAIAVWPTLLQSPLPDGWSFNLELDADYSIKAGSHDSLSWGMVPPSEYSAPRTEDKR